MKEKQNLGVKVDPTLNLLVDIQDAMESVRGIEDPEFCAVLLGQLVNVKDRIDALRDSGVAIDKGEFLSTHHLLEVIKAYASRIRDKRSTKDTPR